jgi:hypothetical protein
MSSQSLKRCVTLSAKGMANIIRENYQKDFKFIVGGHDYLYPVFVPEFLSSRISKSRRSDCTVSEIEVESKDVSKRIIHSFDRFVLSLNRLNYMKFLSQTIPKN